MSAPEPGAYDYLLGPARWAPEAPRKPPPPRKRWLAVAPRAGAPPPPPTGREWGGNGPRVRVEIEIVHGKPAPERSSFLHYVAIWAVIAAAVALTSALVRSAHGEEWRSYKQGWQTVIEGTAPDGSRWTGREYRQGFTTYRDMQGPDGRSVHCRSHKQGWQTVTTCD